MGVPDAYLPQNDIARAAVIVGDGQGVRIVAQTFHSKGKKRLVVLVNMLVFQNQFIPPLQNSQDIWRVAEKKNTRIILQDRKSTRLNSSHVAISYAVFCLNKKNM